MLFNTLIDVAALRALATPPLLLDCRFDLNDPAAGRRAYLAAHIPGAHYADLNRDLSAAVTATSGRHPLPEPAAFARFLAAAAERAAAAPLAPLQVVAYDAANSAFAARAWWLCRWLGITDCAVLDGGFAAWRAAGGPVESGEPAPPRAPAVATDIAAASRSPAPGRTSPAPLGGARSPAWVTTAEVMKSLGDSSRLLVDARAPERFSGRVEPLDPVAGHIPGAVNHPFTSNLAADGRFLPAPELKRLWLERLDGRPPHDVIAMCGSGVTACHNLLALAHADLDGATLYAGSWSEWIRAPDRPVARSGPS